MGVYQRIAGFANDGGIRAEELREGGIGFGDGAAGIGQRHAHGRVAEQAGEIGGLGENHRR